jgi:lysophospholipase L1 and related esterases
MKKILCYGDSNTFGFIPENCKRYDKDSRWSGILSEILKENYQVIEEGMNNRTGFFKNPEGLKQSGGEYLSVFLQNHRNLDICIISLGTNDAQFFYSLDENSTKNGLQNLIDSVREVNIKTKIIIVPPVKITENILHSGFSMMFNHESIDKINKVFPIFEQIAKENNCLYFDFNQITSPAQKDGLHYTKESHTIIANKLAEFILAI